ncbi:hypothetical protein HTV13_07380 [Pseudomonas putida]|uniref:hypothetical protein n=1 Tax=Pseudomonas putida TaxID=303 RepID=UPI0015741C3A|nr:hypothetical protein [Pseudomonas putida]NSX19651.1 hypothetical protein [Pseudomonas putida]
MKEVYASHYGSVVQDYLSLVVEPSLQALQRRRDELADDPDPTVVAFQKLDHLGLEQKTTMAFCLGIQSLWEQQIRTYIVNCIRDCFVPDVEPSEVRKEVEKMAEKARKATWGKELNKLFKLGRGLEMEQLHSYVKLDLLMRLGNVCRHGEGPEATRLYEDYPDLSPSSIMAGVFYIDDMHFQMDRRVTDMQLSFELLQSLVHAVVLFWRDLEHRGLKSVMHGRTDAEIEKFLSNRIRA